jgi:GrpB-like predicted nucleotidyltransferase (UPF0157 family)
MSMRNIVVVEYDERWPEMFQQEAERLRAVFGPLLVDIHHIGSTSVPGLQAKPIIDMMPLVRDITQVDQLNEQMAALGYEAMGECGIPGRRYFRKGGNEHRTHHVHAFQADHPETVDRHLAFRDYLRAHPDTAREYGELKARLAQQFPDDIYGYMEGKDSFVKEVERKALEWYRDQQR